MTSAIQGRERLSVTGMAPLAVPASSLRKVPAEEQAEFARMLQQARAEPRPDPVKAAEHRAVQAHTVVRQAGQIVAFIGRDGQTMSTNAIGARMDWASIEQRSAGMTPAQRRDLIAQELKKATGPGAVVEGYGESGPAPTRGALTDEWNRFALAARQAAGLF